MIEWAVASAPIEGQAVSGDFHLVKVDTDRILIAAIDGAGHGPEAALASHKAAVVLGDRSDQPHSALLGYCHDALRLTRGAAISLASFDIHASALTWSGVGNVEGMVLRNGNDPGLKNESLLLRNGVIGYQFLPPRVSTLAVHPGDQLIFATDGIRATFLDGIEVSGPPRAIAQSILARHSKGTDDALVLVIRFLEKASR